MSRIGKMPIQIPEKVEVKLNQGELLVKGPLGSHSLKVDLHVQIEVKDGQVIVTRKGDDRESRSRHGLVRVLVQNMVVGVSKGFSKELDVVGVGYRAEVKGKDLNLALGFSHPVIFPIPEGIQVKVEKLTKMIITGSDRQLVGETAAKIRGYRPPEPYKGKGVKYADEVIVRKAGKTAGAGSK
jgi:large subunit ribosomal protein L6